HYGAERPQILDPRRLLEKRREVVISKNEDRMLRHVAREYHGVRPRLVRLVRDGVERREVEHVPWSGGHDPVEAARLHGVKQAIEVAKALRQRPTREGIGGRGRRSLHHDQFSLAQPCICRIVELAPYRLPKRLTDISRGAVMRSNDDSTSPSATDRFLGG